MNTINLLDHAKASQIMWFGVLKAACDRRDDGATKLAWKGYCRASDRIDHLTGGKRPCAEVDPETWKVVIAKFSTQFHRVPAEGDFTRQRCMAYLRAFESPMAGYEKPGSISLMA
jgi:hypothetical protein